MLELDTSYLVTPNAHYLGLSLSLILNLSLPAISIPSTSATRLAMVLFHSPILTRVKAQLIWSAASFGSTTRPGGEGGTAT